MRNFMHAHHEDLSILRDAILMGIFAFALLAWTLMAVRAGVL